MGVVTSSRKVGAALAVVALGAGGVALSAAPAHAAGAVSVTNGSGQAVADPDYATKVTVSGRGFQSVKGGHGGVYVWFGTVKGSWQPSKGGATGRDYFYVPDAESGRNNGFQKYVAFPGADTGGEANGGTLSESGSFSTTLTIPGATFQAADRNGKATTIDCLTVRCGVITVGAHGVKNANNETFTPVRFVKGSAVAQAGAAPNGAAPNGGVQAGSQVEGAQTGGSQTGGSQTGGAQGPAQGTQAPAVPTAPPPGQSPVAQGTVTPTPDVPSATPGAVSGPTGKPRLSIDDNSARAGAALSFTAAGLAPGRQVTVVLDDGAAASGPFLVGADGTFAGVIQVPAEVGAGTHELRVFGVKKAPKLNFALAAGEEPLATMDEVEQVSATETSEGKVAIALTGLAGGLVLVALVRLGLGLRRGKPSHG